MQTTYRSQSPIQQPQPQQQQIVLRTRPAPSDHDFGGQQARRVQQNRGQQLTVSNMEDPLFSCRNCMIIKLLN